MIIVALLTLIGLHTCDVLRRTKKIEYTDSASVHHVKYHDGKFSDLKKENEQLYDSLKNIKTD